MCSVQRGYVRRIVVQISIFLAVIVSTFLLCTVGFAGSSANVESWQVSCQGLFKQDFSTYWLWVNYWIHGHNPYDTDRLRAYASSLNCVLTGSHYVPPFIVPLLVPVMVWPLNVAAVLWALLNVLMVAHITRVMLREWRPTIRVRGPIAVGLLVFSPATAACLAYGQFGILCAWAMVMASRSALRSTSLLPGVLSLAAIKPHLGFIYWLGFLGDTVRSRKVGVCVGAGGIMVLSTALVEVLTPGAISSWLNGAGGALTWMGASPITYLRLLAQTSQRPVPLWPVVVGPLLALVYAIWHLKSAGRPFHRRLDLPLFAALSLCSTPYLWSLDFSVLLITELAVLVRFGSSSSSDRRLRVAAGIVMIARVVLASQMLLGVSDYRTGWYPAAILLAAVLAGL